MTCLLTFMYILGCFFQKKHIRRAHQKKMAHRPKTWGGGADAPSDPPSPCSGGNDLPLQSKQKETQKKKFMFVVVI